MGTKSALTMESRWLSMEKMNVDPIEVLISRSRYRFGRGLVVSLKTIVYGSGIALVFFWTGSPNWVTSPMPFNKMLRILLAFLPSLELSNTLPCPA